MQMYFRVRHFDRYVGMLVITAVVLAIIAVVFVARGQKWFAKRAEYKVVFNNGHGLKPGTPVTISGMEVGNVKSLQLTAQSQVVMTVNVLQKYKPYIRQDSEATIISALLGGKTLEITAGSPDQPLLPEGSVLPSEEPKEITDIVKDIDIKTPLKKLEEALENVRTITARINDPQGELFTTLKNVEFVTAQLKNGEGNLGAILQDKNIHRGISDSIASVRRSLSQVEEATRNVNTVSRNLPGVMGEVDRAVKEVPPILQQVKDATSGLSSILEDVKKTTVQAPAIAEDLKEITQGGKGVVQDVKGITGDIQKSTPGIPDFLATTQETVEDADQLILGLKNHWLLRGSMPKVKGETPIAISERESPYEKRGESNR